MLTIEMLKAMPLGTIFAEGKAKDVEGELFMANTGKELHWIAKRGHGPLDWAIYYHFATDDLQAIEHIAQHGDKVCFDKNIRFCVPCDDEALKEYRR